MHNNTYSTLIINYGTQNLTGTKPYVLSSRWQVPLSNCTNYTGRAYSSVSSSYYIGGKLFSCNSLESSLMGSALVSQRWRIATVSTCWSKHIIVKVLITSYTGSLFTANIFFLCVHFHTVITFTPCWYVVIWL